jgi:hypothetical protein
MTLVPWKRGRCLIWDFTCVDIFAASHLRCSSVAPGGAAASAEVLKHRKYADLERRFTFVPVAVETSGVFGKEGLSFIRELGVRVGTVTGEQRAPAYLLQRLSLAVQRGNVAAVLGTLPAGKELDEIFFFRTARSLL